MCSEVPARSLSILIMSSHLISVPGPKSRSGDNLGMIDDLSNSTVFGPEPGNMEFSPDIPELILVSYSTLSPFRISDCLEVVSNLHVPK